MTYPPSGAILRIGVKFLNTRFVAHRGDDTLTGLSFHAEVNVKKLGKCEEHGATSAVFDSGAIMQHVIVVMRPTGVFGLKFVTSPVKSLHNFSESVFGPFWEETAGKVRRRGQGADCGYIGGA